MSTNPLEGNAVPPEEFDAKVLNEKTVGNIVHCASISEHDLDTSKETKGHWYAGETLSYPCKRCGAIVEFCYANTVTYAYKTIQDQEKRNEFQESINMDV